jgi:hypothetical protein
MSLEIIDSEQLKLVKTNYETGNLNFAINHNYIVNSICKNGYLKTLEWIYTVFPDMINTHHENLFIEACKNGHLNIVEWLYKIHGKTYRNGYNYACIKGYCDIVKWFINLDSTIIDSYSGFVLVCKYGHLNIATQLYELYDSSKISMHLLNNAFIWSLLKENYVITDWLLLIKPDIIDYFDKSKFHDNCLDGNLLVVQWYSIRKPSIATSFITIELLIQVCETCEENDTEIVIWLYQMNPTVDIIYKNHALFRAICANRNEELFNWISKLNPLYKPDKMPINMNKTKINIEGYEKICPICYSKEVCLETNCGHRFCDTCIRKWWENPYNHFCPCCRELLTEFTSFEQF